MIEKENEVEGRNDAIANANPNPLVHVKANLPSFHCKLAKLKKEDNDEEILEVFRKVKINILLLDAIKQVPKYTKVWKDLCANKRKLRGDK